MSLSWSLSPVCLRCITVLPSVLRRRLIRNTKRVVERFRWYGSLVPQRIHSLSTLRRQYGHTTPQPHDKEVSINPAKTVTWTLPAPLFMFRSSSAPQAAQICVSSVPKVNQSKCAIIRTFLPRIVRHSPLRQSLALRQGWSPEPHLTESIESCRGVTAAYSVAGSAMKSTRIERRMRMIVGTVRFCSPLRLPCTSYRSYRITLTCASVKT